MMKKLFNPIKLWLLRKLLKDLCKNSGGCRMCNMRHYCDGNLGMMCAETLVSDQANHVWGKD